MPHNTQNEIQKASLIGRILSIEAFLLLMGIATLTYGIANDMVMSIFWGCVIIPGVFILHQVRKRDWTAQWQVASSRDVRLPVRGAGRAVPRVA